ncbi:MAG: hypothetical protein LBQ56_04315 [Synergistaceae bacterium]|jgi:hypothetical protein|nr:hypothetical protein [Synergistaceae bacterium]
MINFSEIREMPEARRLFRLAALAAVAWAGSAVLLFQTADVNSRLRENLASGDRIINAASVYRAHPGREADVPRPAEEDPMSVITGIVQTLGIRERMQNLRSDSSGVSVQFDRLYGSELREFLSTMESRGLRVRTAEIRALPSGGERLLGVTLQMERS